MVAVSKVARLALGAALGLVLATSANAADLTLKLGHLANENNSWHKASLKFGEEVARLTEGRIAVEVYPNDSLGREIDLINGMQLGTVEMTITGESLQNWAPKAAMLALPYAYKSLEHMDQVASGDIGKDIEAEIIERAQVRPLGYFARGPRNLTSNKPITTPADLAGVKLRTMQNPVHIRAFEKLGASPVPMAWGEVFTSLGQGVIDGQENPITIFYTNSLWEVQSDITLSGHVYGPHMFLASKSVWESWPEEVRQAILEALPEATAFQRAESARLEAEQSAKLKENGVKISEIDTAPFREIAQSIYSDFTFDPAVIERIRAAAKN